MAIRPVLRMGDARLRQRAEPVIKFGSEELLALLADMRDTMQATGGVGLAAPQIGVGLRVVIFGVTPSSSGQEKQASRYPNAEGVPETALINPVITVLDDRIEEAWEGCLSIPGLRGMVPRFGNIRYQGYDEHGALIDRAVSGFHARVVQHECDHLDGILYPGRMSDMTQFGYLEELFPERAVQGE